MGARQIRNHCMPNAEGKGCLEHAMAEMNFSARSHDRIINVARTLADLAGKPNVTGSQVLVSIRFGSLERQFFAI